MSQSTPAQPAAGSGPDPSGWVTNAGRGPVRAVDWEKFPRERFGGQLLYESDAITVIVSRDPPRAHGPQSHYHGQDQFFWTLRGQLELDLGLRSYTLQRGSMAHIPAGTPHRHRNDGDLDEVHLELLAPGFSFGAPNMTFVDEDGEWWAGGSVVHLPEVGEWPVSGGVRSFTFSDPSGTVRPALPESHNAMLAVVSTEPDAGGHPGMHVHPFDQLYFVTEGTLHVDLALHHHAAGPSSLVIIPAGVPHREAPGGFEVETHLVMNVPPPAPGDQWETPVVFGPRQRD